MRRGQTPEKEMVQDSVGVVIEHSVSEGTLKTLHTDTRTLPT